MWGQWLLMYEGGRREGRVGRVGGWGGVAGGWCMDN